MDKMIKHGYGYGMNKWMDILSVDAIAPERGLYMFACKGDNHVLHEFYFLHKGERLFKYFEGKYGHCNGYFPVIPIDYHYIPEYSPSCQTKDWRKFNINDEIKLYGFIVLAFVEKISRKKIYYTALDISKDDKRRGWGISVTWKEYLQEKYNNIIHSGNSYFDFTGWGCYKDGYNKFHLSDTDILAYSCIFPFDEFNNIKRLIETNKFYHMIK